MVYIRGNRRDYDGWEAMGNTGWGYDEALKYFMKSEGNQIDWLVEESQGKYHRTSGPLKVDGFDSNEHLRTVISGAASELGIPEYYDINVDGNHIGFSSMQGTLYKGKRFNTAKAFLAPIKDRANLHVLRNHTVTELIMNKKLAEGVKLQSTSSPSIKYEVRARKEVILSAGALGSPKILMLSGIGKKKDLEKLEIPVIKDLPVGYNLQDHVVVPLHFQFNKHIARDHDYRELIDSFYFYLKHGWGKMSGTRCSDYNGFVNTVDKTSIYPDIQYILTCQPKKMFGYKEALQNFAYTDDFIEQQVKENAAAETLQSYVTLLNPKSRGTVKLRSKTPEDFPIIDANYFEDREDVETVLRGIREFLRLLDTDSFKENDGELFRFKIAECDKLEYDSDDYWRCYITYMSSTIFHASGTCKMGPASDSEAVVSPELKVHGIEGLRVIDASIMPKILSSGLNAPTVMIAEKASDMIKEAWKETV